MKSKAFGGKHVPAKVMKANVNYKIENPIRLKSRIRTLADLQSKLKNETVSSKLKRNV
jgi:hypothetical protein